MLKDVWYALWHKPATQAYPSPVPNSPERLRGKLHWDASLCTGCQLCVKDCPSQALEMFVLDREAKRFVMRYDMNRCIYCAQCLQNCRFHAIRLAHDEWSFSGDSPERFIFRYGECKETDDERLGVAARSTPDIDPSTASPSLGERGAKPARG